MSLQEGKHTESASRLRCVWLALGHGAIGLGAIGAFVPLLPTTPFLLIAAWAYARSSPTLKARLQAHPRFGPAVWAWQAEGAISRRAKLAAIIAMILSWTLAAMGDAGALLLTGLGATLTSVAFYIVTRPEPSQHI